MRMKKTRSKTDSLQFHVINSERKLEDFRIYSLVLDLFTFLVEEEVAKTVSQIEYGRLCFAARNGVL